MASTSQSKLRAKYFYIKRKQIEPLIQEGKIDANDIIYTTDTHENIFIGADLSINSVRSKVYRFVDVKSAEEELNTAKDTYAGQLVAILDDGVYTAYIVNKNVDGSFYVTKLSEDAKTLNYDTLGNRPINNLDGTLEEPVTISDLSTGIYKIRGQYKICENDITTYLSANDNIFLVSNTNDNILIKKITSGDIVDFVVSEGSITSQSEIPTKKWIENHGYVTETYVNEKIAALDFVTKEDVQNYVTNIITENIEPLIDARIDTKLNESLSSAETSDITYLF